MVNGAAPMGPRRFQFSRDGAHGVRVGAPGETEPHPPGLHSARAAIDESEWGRSGIMGGVQHRATALDRDLERYRRTRSVLPMLAASLSDEDLQAQSMAEASPGK